MKDPNRGNLDRIQIIKGWVDAGVKTRKEDLRRLVQFESETGPATTGWAARTLDQFAEVTAPLLDLIVL